MDSIGKRNSVLEIREFQEKKKEEVKHEIIKHIDDEQRIVT